MILVTGGAGFIGSRLIGALRRLGEPIVSLDDYSTGSVANHLVDPLVEYRRGETARIAELVPERPRLIFHLGEYARVERSFLERARVHRSNIEGTAAVLAFWQACDAKLIYAGSSTLFGRGTNDSPYARAKRMNVFKVRSIALTDFKPFATAFFYNVYGPGERAGDHGTLVEIFRRQRFAGEPLTVVAPGTQRRNFTHVDDIVAGLMLLAERGIGEFPIGAAESYSVLEVAAMFGGPFRLLPPRKGNRDDSTLDVSAIAGLGWRQRRTLKDYIALALDEAAA